MKTKFNILFSFVIVTVVLFAAVPKVYIYSFVCHTHTIINRVSDAFSFGEEENTRDSNYQKFETPAYYTVFKFILNFLPLKETKQTSFFYDQRSFPDLQLA